MQTTQDAPPSRTGRVIVIIIVVLLLAMWGYVLYLAFGPGRADPIDQLDDPSYAAAAEQRCAAALEVIDTLPRAETEAGRPRSRATTVATANDEYRAMLADLRHIALTSERDQRLVGLWLDDWNTVMGDREAFVEDLRTGDPDARMLVSTSKSGRQVTLMLDEFAAANHMTSCGAPTDA